MNNVTKMPDNFEASQYEVNLIDRWNTIKELENVLDLDNEMMKGWTEWLVKDAEIYLNRAVSYYNNEQYRGALECFARVLCIYRFIFEKRALHMDTEKYVDGYVYALKKWCCEVIMPNKKVIDPKYLAVARAWCGHLEVICWFYKESSLIRKKWEKDDVYNWYLNIILGIVDGLK